MFKRIIYDDWTSIIPLISFWLTFGVFLAIIVRALFLKNTTVNHMENLPLNEDEKPTSNAASK
jgi:cbb3-type cytochrome oxidase subunit 3